MLRTLRTMVATFMIALLPALAAPRRLGHARRRRPGLIGGGDSGRPIRIVNESTGAAADAVSDGQGSYRAAALVPGRYRVETRLDGFDRRCTGSRSKAVSQRPWT